MVGGQQSYFPSIKLICDFLIINYNYFIDWEKIIWRTVAIDISENNIVFIFYFSTLPLLLKTDCLLIQYIMVVVSVFFSPPKSSPTSFRSWSIPFLSLISKERDNRQTEKYKKIIKWSRNYHIKDGHSNSTGVKETHFFSWWGAP